MITNAMRATLVEELEFEPEEVDVMRPEIAAELIEKKMKRPRARRPMPDQWKRDYDGGGDGGGRRGFGLGPLGDLFRSLFYMERRRRILPGRGVRGLARAVARAGVRSTYKEARRDVRRMLKGRSRGNAGRGRGAASSRRRAVEAGPPTPADRTTFFFFERVNIL